jgi:hypothetical protein
MPLDFTAVGATGVHALAKTNVNVEDNFFYYNPIAGQSRPAVFTENSPWLVRNLTGSIGGLTSGSLYFIRPVEGKGFSLATTSGGTAIDITSVSSGNITFNTPFVFNNRLNLAKSFTTRQAVKYFTNSTPLTGMVSGTTYFLRQVENPGFGEASLYSFTAHTFTTGGATGRNAPTLSTLTTAYNNAGATWATSTSNLNQGNFQGYQDWTVPISGLYEFEVKGAAGRASTNAAGGGGAVVKGRVQLTKGEIITIAVGQRGMSSSESGTGGPNNWPGASGGTFVVRKTGNVPLFIAGGGGSATTNKVGFDAAITSNGGLGEGSPSGNGVNGNGATAGQTGGSGGGFLSAGSGAQFGGSGGGFNNGLVGGVGTTGGDGGGNGGFGGAGGGDGSSVGGPGGSGGYSGGNAGTGGNTRGGAGGSFIVATATAVATSDGTYNGSNIFNSIPITNLNSRNTGVSEGSVLATLVQSNNASFSVHSNANDANSGSNAIAVAAEGSQYHALVPITLDLDANTINIPAGHGLSSGDALVYRFTGTAPTIAGTPPTSLAADTTYYADIVNPYSFRVSTTPSPTFTNLDFTVPAGATNQSFGKVIANIATDSITIPSHGFQAGQPIRYSTGGGTPILPLQNLATYYVKTVVDSNNIQLSQSLGGPVINLTAAGTGTSHSFIYVVVNVDEDSLYIPGHDLVTGSRVVYSAGAGTAIGGLTSGQSYFISKIDNNIIKLATNKEGTNLVNLTSLGVGNHTLTTNQLNLADNQISIPAHGFSQGELVQYDSVGQTVVGGLSSGSPYYIILIDGDNIKLATTLENSNANTAIDLTQVGVGVHRILSLSKSPDGTYTVNGVPTTTTFTVPANGFVPNIVKTFTPRSVVDLQQNNMRILSHGFITGTAVTYSAAGGTAIGGLTNATVYYVINISKDHLQLASTVENASSGVPIVLTTFGGGVDHTLTSSQINGFVTGTGTVSTTSGSTLVSGTNTAFAKILKVGDTFRLYPPNITTTVTFASAAVITNPTNTITSNGHTFSTGDSVVYTAGIGSVAPTGLTSTFFYFVRRVDANTIALYNTSSDAVNNTNRVVITTQGSGTTHTLVRTIPSSPILRKITAIGSDTQVTVNRPYGTPYSAVSYAYQTFVYVRPQGYSLHRPFDGGVEMSTGVGTSNAQIIRQTRKYFRYQSGKGLQTSAGINFKPTIDLEKVVRVSNTTFQGTSRRPHGLINGLFVTISEARTSLGALSNVYNGTFQVTVIDPLNFTCIATSTIPSGAEAKAYGFPQFNVDSWSNGAIRSGMFDFQNGMFFEFDGQKMYAVRRSSTQQMAGTAAALQGSEFIFGTGTTFTTQLAVNDYIVMRGQSYKVTSILSDTRITVKPEYKGASGIEKEFNPGNGTTGVVRLATDEFVIQNHGFVDSLPVVYDSIDGTPIGGLINGRTYYVHLVDNNTFALKATPDAVSDVTISTVGAGSPHSFTPAKSGIIMTKTVDTRVPQENWSIDPCDGTGPTGFNLNLNRIQMVYIDYSWYGAGKIRFGFKDQTGEVKYVHEFIHNNILLESYFRSGNLPARYEVTTYTDPTYIPFLFHWGTSVIMDGKFDDDKAYLFSGSSQTLTIAGTTAKNFGSRAINLATDQINIPTHGFTSGDGVQFVGLTPAGLTGVNTQNPTTANTGTNPFNNLINSRVYYIRAVDANNVTLHPTQADATATGGTNRIDITSQGNSQYVFNLFPLGSLNNTSGANYQPLLSLRLSPSVSEGLTGKLGDRDVINRMQLRTKELAVATTQLVDVKVLINPRLNNLNFVSVPSPSLTQVIAHTANDTVSGGVQVFNFRAAGQSGTEQSTTVSLDELFELSNSILGGDSVFPDGPDILTIAVARLTGSTTLASAKLTWTEAQA